LSAILDTGFDGDLCVPTAIAIQAGLELTGEQFVELADGSQKKQLVFTGSVRFAGCVHPVEVLLTESQDALIGTRLLSHYALAIEFPGAGVNLRPPLGRRTRRRP